MALENWKLGSLAYYQGHPRIPHVPICPFEYKEPTVVVICEDNSRHTNFCFVRCFYCRRRNMPTQDSCMMVSAVDYELLPIEPHYEVYLRNEFGVIPWTYT